VRRDNQAPSEAGKTQQTPPPALDPPRAKVRLSEGGSGQAGPQIITRNGKPSAVVVLAEERS
jgi:hypothetical protein